MDMTRKVSSTSSRLARLEAVDVDEFVRSALRNQHRIEHAGEGVQAALVLALLEQRPAVLVQALVVEPRARADARSPPRRRPAPPA